MSDAELDQITKIERRLSAVEGRMTMNEQELQSVRKELEANTASTNLIKTDTAELLDILRTGKSFFKFSNMIGRFIRFVGGIAVGLGAIIQLFGGGGGSQK